MLFLTALAGLLLCWVAWLVLPYVVRNRLEHFWGGLLGSPVRVEEIQVRPRSLLLKRVHLAQPEGFGSGDAILVQEVNMQYHLFSLASKSPHVQQVTFLDCTINYREAEKTTNIAKFSEAIAKYLQSPHETGYLLRIDRLELLQVHGFAEFSGSSTSGPTEFALPDLELVDLRGTFSEVADQVSRQVGEKLTGELGSVQAVLHQGNEAVQGTVLNLQATGERLFNSLRQLFSPGASAPAQNESPPVPIPVD